MAILSDLSAMFARRFKILRFFLDFKDFLKISKIFQDFKDFERFSQYFIDFIYF